MGWAGKRGVLGFGVRVDWRVGGAVAGLVNAGRVAMRRSSFGHVSGLLRVPGLLLEANRSEGRGVVVDAVVLSRGKCVVVTNDDGGPGVVSCYAVSWRK